MKILVPLKRVADPDNANKVKIPASGDKIETTGLEWKPNPFDEYALEAALRLTEDGKAPEGARGRGRRRHLRPEGDGAVRCAPRSRPAPTAPSASTRPTTSSTATSSPARSRRSSRRRSRTSSLMGKQAVDGDSNQVGQILAELLDWPMATFAATIQEERARCSSAARSTAACSRCASRSRRVVTVDLRIVAPTSVYSMKTAPHLQVQRRRPLRRAARPSWPRRRSRSSR